MSKAKSRDILKLKVTQPDGVYRLEDYQMSESIGYLLKRSFAMLSSALDQDLAPYDLTHPQFAILMMLKERNCSTFTAECHVRYLREIHLGDPVQVSILLVAADEKRLHTFKELRHATEGWLSATSENMTLHMDMNVRKTAPFPPDIRARIDALADAHSTILRPEGIGRKVAMPSK